MKKLLIMSLLLTSTAYAQKNDIHIELENQSFSSYDDYYEASSYTGIVNFTFSHSFTDSVYTTTTFSSGSGRTTIAGYDYYDVTPHDYSAFKMGIGFKF